MDAGGMAEAHEIAASELEKIGGWTSVAVITNKYASEISKQSTCESGESKFFIGKKGKWFDNACRGVFSEACMGLPGGGRSIERL